MMQLLLNRVEFQPTPVNRVLLMVRATPKAGSAYGCNSVGRIAGRLGNSTRHQFEEWVGQQHLATDSLIETRFTATNQNLERDLWQLDLGPEQYQLFETEMLKQEICEHLRKQSLLTWQGEAPDKFAAYALLDTVAEDAAVRNRWPNGSYQRFDFSWCATQRQLSMNVDMSRVYLDESQAEEGRELQHKVNTDNVVWKETCGTQPKPVRLVEQRNPQEDGRVKGQYRRRFQLIQEIARGYLYNLRSRFFSIDKTGFVEIADEAIGHIGTEHDLMVFRKGQTDTQAGRGLRSFGPAQSVRGDEPKQLLFIYQDVDEANLLFRYLKYGHKHYPGLLSFAGIQTIPAEPKNAMRYNTVEQLPADLMKFLDQHFPNDGRPNTIALIVYNGEQDSLGVPDSTYNEVKELFLRKGIVSQFVNRSTLHSPAVHYKLFPLAIGILAKLGGTPWTIPRRGPNQLIVGLHVEGDACAGTPMGVAVVFTSEGYFLGTECITCNGNANEFADRLQAALDPYIAERANGSKPSMVFHCSKTAITPERDQVRNQVLESLEEMSFGIPTAILDIDESVNFQDFCYDLHSDSGIPQRGLSVRTGHDEYLLYTNSPSSRENVDVGTQAFPINIRLRYVYPGAFLREELLAQVYDFSLLHWQHLERRRIPVTSDYPAKVRDFVHGFKQPLPNNKAATRTAWFI